MLENCHSVTVPTVCNGDHVSLEPLQWALASLDVLVPTTLLLGQCQQTSFSGRLKSHKNLNLSLKICRTWPEWIFILATKLTQKLYLRCSSFCMIMAALFQAFIVDDCLHKLLQHHMNREYSGVSGVWGGIPKQCKYRWWAVYRRCNLSGGMHPARSSKLWLGEYCQCRCGWTTCWRGCRLLVPERKRYVSRWLLGIFQLLVWRKQWHTEWGYVLCAIYFWIFHWFPYLVICKLRICPWSIWQLLLNLQVMCHFDVWLKNFYWTLLLFLSDHGSTCFHFNELLQNSNTKFIVCLSMTACIPLFQQSLRRFFSVKK